MTSSRLRFGVEYRPAQVVRILDAVWMPLCGGIQPRGDLRAGHEHAGGVVYLMWPRILKELRIVAVEKDVWTALPAAIATRMGKPERLIVLPAQLSNKECNWATHSSSRG